MFKIGIYNKRGSDYKVFLFDEQKGFTITDTGIGGYYMYNSFDSIDNNYVLSTEQVLELIYKINTLGLEEYLKKDIIEVIIKDEPKYNVINRFLVSENEDEIIKIDDISRIKKINNDFIELNISGEIKTILCNEFDTLKDRLFNKNNIL